jgi:hypothetical protein
MPKKNFGLWVYKGLIIRLKMEGEKAVKGKPSTTSVISNITAICDGSS